MDKKEIMKIIELLTRALNILCADGCEDCKYYNKRSWEIPCSDCRNTHVSHWEHKGDINDE